MFWGYLVLVVVVISNGCGIVVYSTECRVCSVLLVVGRTPTACRLTNHHFTNSPHYIHGLTHPFDHVARFFFTSWQLYLVDPVALVSIFQSREAQNFGVKHSGRSGSFSLVSSLPWSTSLPPNRLSLLSHLAHPFERRSGGTGAHEVVSDQRRQRLALP